MTKSQRPQPDDVLLVIEVSESTLDYDRFTKAGLYAEAGFADYWVVNIPAQCIEVFRNPQGGKYRDVRSVGRDASVRPLCFPDIELPVSLLFDL